MDSESIYSAIGVVILIIITMIIFRSDVSKVKRIKTKTQKKEEIVDGYKTQLQEALKGLDKDSRVMEKSMLLKKFSDELSQNIFFDKNEIREIILTLSQL